MDAARARNRKALKAAQMALQGVGDDAVDSAFQAVERVISEYRYGKEPEPEKADAPKREQSPSRNRQERSGKTRSAE